MSHSKSKNINIVLIVLIVATSILFSNLNQRSSINKQTAKAADWLDIGYDYRQAITIDNSASSNELTNYPVKLSEGLLGNFKFDENTGTTTADSSSRSGLGTLYPAASGGTGPSWSSGGKYNKALLFDGTEDYVSTNYALVSGQRDFTISVWIKTAQTAQGGARNLDPAILGIQQGDGDTNDFVLTNNNGYLGWYDELTSGTNTYTSNTAINDNAWHNVIVSRANTALNFYVDGTNIGSDTTGSDPVGRTEIQWTSTGYYIELGRALATNSLYYNGSIDAFRLYDHALNQTEVTSLATNNTLSRFGAIYDNTQADGDDIRFTTSNGTTQLDFWTEAFSQTAEEYVGWVEIPTIASNSTVSIYMYYKNASAVSASNGSNTFSFFDDFNDGSIDGAKWTTEGSANTETGGYYKSAGAWEDPRNNLISVNTFANSSIIDFRWKQTNQYANMGQQMTYGTGSTYYGVGMFEGDMYKFQRNDPYGIIAAYAKYDSNKYGVANLTIKSTGAIACADYTRGCTTNNDASLNNKNIEFRGWVTDMYVDWVKVRPYTTIEPTFSLVGDREQADAVAPTNPNVFAAYSTSGKTISLTTDSWYNYTNPYFEWSGATDDNSGVKGYWTYFGTTSNATPATDGSYQAGATFTSAASLVSGSTYYFRIQTEDNMGNKSSAETKFIYKFDSTSPTAPEYINVSPVGCSTAINFTFTWPAGADTGGSNIAGYDYKRGSTGTVLQTSDLSIAVNSYQEGDNVFYLRSRDTAGNVSTWQTAVFCSTAAVQLIDGPTVAAGPSSITTTWVSSKATTGYIKVYDGNLYISEQGLTNYSLTHVVKVIGLEPEKAYRYQITWSDQSGNIGESTWYETNTATAPQINNLKIEVLSPSAVNASWSSTVPAKFNLEYGIGSYGTNINNVDFLTGSSLKLSSLAAGSNYQLRVNATSDDGTKFFAGESFTMPPLPTIGGLKFEPIPDRPDTAIKVSWTTNTETTSSVFYGLEGGAKTEISKSDRSKDHEVEIGNLNDNSEYEIYASGIDAFGNLARSGVSTLKTDFDTRPPKIDNISTESSNIGSGQNDKSKINVGFSTDEAAKCFIEYGEGISGTSYSGRTTDEDTHSTSHLAVVSDLKPQAPYHLRINCSDKAGNKTTSSDQTVISGEITASVFSIIIKTLNNLFGWLGTKL